jgi:hypothetical protein
MKLDPNAIEIVSFDTTDALSGAEGDVNTPLCTILPTQCTHCLPCD